MAGIYAQTFARARKHWRTALIIVLAFVAGACGAASNPPSPGAPNPNASPYPILLTDEQGDRRQTALAAWTRLLHEQGITSAQQPELQPVTATLSSLPQLPVPLYLPKVGEGIPMTEEETRESLRRFINAHQELLGIDPQLLSLVERVDAADGTKRALYQQRPFLRYNFRNGFGRVEITFAPDRRILNISSTAIPEIERLRVAGAGVAPRAELQTAELVAKNLAGRTIAYTDAAGRALSYTVTAQNRVTPHQFVVYPVLREDAPPALEFHLAWEIVIEGAPFRIIYLDAITNDILSATNDTPPEL
jgi:hypothetical protein